MIALDLTSELITMFRSNDLVGLGMEADRIRQTLHPERIVTYSVAGTVSSDEDTRAVLEKTKRIADIGGTDVFLSGHTLEWYQKTLRSIKETFEIQCHGFSILEIATLAQNHGLSHHEILLRLKDAGLDSISGHSAVTLNQNWIDIHTTAHSLGMPTVAAVEFSAGTSPEQLMDQLAPIHQIQQETNSFTAFIPWLTRGATTVEYLKLLALSRVYLDNISHVESSGVSNDWKVRQLTLRFGGDDLGCILTNEGSATVEQLRLLIRDAGFKPIQRDTLYRTYLLN